MVRDGLLIIDKPAGPTSHDVVQRVRRALGTQRVGHGGTLDPDATGVLLVAVGRATRFFPFLSQEAKSYDGRIRLGFATDTYDASGRPAAEERRDLPDPGRLEAAMKTFEGPILQTPPRFSAKKVRGRPVYRLARADTEFTLEPAAVTVFRFGLRAYRPPFVEFEAECSAGPYRLSDAVLLAVLEEEAARGEGGRRIIPVEELLPDAPSAVVRPEAEARVMSGSLLGPAHLENPPVPEDAALVRLFSGTGRLLALARPKPDGSGLHPFLVLS